MATSAELMKSVSKTYGSGVAAIADKQYEDRPRLPTGVFPLDLAMGGGFPMGKCSEIYGPESCLDKDSFVQYEVRKPSGKRQNHKGGSIERLWHRFHGTQMPGQGAYQRHTTIGSEFFAPSINDEGRVFQNRILDVVKCGEKECFLVVTKSGLRLIATTLHKFYIGSGYVPLSELQVGMSVFAHQNTPYTCELKNKGAYRKHHHVKHHPVAGVHVAGGLYVYHRLAQSRAVIEAYNSGLSLDTYLRRLNDGELSGLVFLPRELHVYHKDEDFNNDTLDNLVVIPASEHGREHATARHNNLRYVVLPDEIVSIDPVGMRETYDLRMESPANNYVANGIVVHNSGKTNLLYKAIGQGQLMYPDKVAVFVDAEHGFDPVWAASMGVDVGRVVLVHPEYAEQAADIIEQFLYATDAFMVGLDSIAALTTQNEADSSTEKAAVGGASNLIGKLYRKITVAYQKMGNAGAHAPAFIAVNQIRIKIGVLFGNPETRPGGNAPRFAGSMILRTYGKNEVVKSISAVMPAYKEMNCVLTKWKVPIIAVNAKFKMAMLPIAGNPPGHVEDWNTLYAYMKELDYISKGEKNGWVMLNEEFQTLEAAKTRLYSDPAMLQELRATIIAEMLSQGTPPAAEEMIDGGDEPLAEEV